MNPSKRKGYRRARGPLGALILGVLLALVPVSFADTTVVRDRAGDGPSGAADDIRKVTIVHANGETLKHVVVVRRANRITLRHIEFQIRVGKTMRRQYVLLSDRVVNRATGEQTGTVEAQRRKNRITFIFSPKAIGDPSAYRWQALANLGGDRVDSAPNRGYKRHVLREPDADGKPAFDKQ